MLKKLDRVVYKVADLAEAKLWYRGILNQDPIYESPFAALFKIDGSMLTLIPKENGVDDGENAVAYWETDDIATTFRQFIEAGCRPRREIRASHDIRIGSVIDPFGNIIGLIGKNEEPEKTSVENHPSETALIVASLRALAFHDEREEIRGRDHLAEIFLTDERKKPLYDPTIRAWIMENAMPAGMYEYLIARTAYFDRIVERALESDIPQIVFLGAGYDSRAYRFRDRIRSTRIFELDAKPTQERKLDLLRRANIDIPDQVTFAPINFNIDDFGEVLVRNGYIKTEKTTFIWEGVSFYLSKEAVDRTLSQIAAYAPSGSEVCFDFQSFSSEGGQGFRTVTPGETIKFGIGEGRIGEFLAERGFELVEHVTAGDMENRFLRLKDSTLAGKISPALNLVCAVIIH